MQNKTFQKPSKFSWVSIWKLKNKHIDTSNVLPKICLFCESWSWYSFESSYNEVCACFQIIQIRHYYNVLKVISVLEIYKFSNRTNFWQRGGVPSTVASWASSGVEPSSSLWLDGTPSSCRRIPLFLFIILFLIKFILIFIEIYKYQKNQIYQKTKSSNPQQERLVWLSSCF